MRHSEDGFSLIEVMIAMVILAFGILGVMGSFRWADHGLRYGANGTRALAMAESRLEAKRAAPWVALLTDDLNADGTPDLTMRDDGTQGDVQAGDGVFTSFLEEGGIRLTWTVRPDRSGPPLSAGAVVIEAQASYSTGQGQRREIRLGTLRANPRYLGGG